MVSAILARARPVKNKLFGILRQLRSRIFLHCLEPLFSFFHQPPKDFAPVFIRDEADYLHHVTQARAFRSREWQIEDGARVADDAPQILTRGYCYVCQRWTRFSSTWAFASNHGGRRQINWREHLVCPLCRLNNRMRASVHLLDQLVSPASESHLYVTEQITPLFRTLRLRHSQLCGSEFLGSTVACGATNANGIRNEDLTKLTFADARFDAVLSFEVFEHVPAFPAALRECARILKPGGMMLFSVPFNPGASRNLIRARVTQGDKIEHLLPPEYHGDPLNSTGCLCFQHFGWELLEDVKRAGFSSVSAIFYHSIDFGYLGGEQIQFLATK
jgi:hypothetical protein